MSENHETTENDEQSQIDESARETETPSRIDTGASDAFADDRKNTGNLASDGESDETTQSTLVPGAQEGQATFDGKQACEPTEYMKRVGAATVDEIAANPGPDAGGEIDHVRELSEGDRVTLDGSPETRAHTVRRVCGRRAKLKRDGKETRLVSRDGEIYHEGTDFAHTVIKVGASDENAAVDETDETAEAVADGGHAETVIECPRCDAESTLSTETAELVDGAGGEIECPVCAGSIRLGEDCQPLGPFPEAPDECNGFERVDVGGAGPWVRWERDADGFEEWVDIATHPRLYGPDLGERYKVTYRVVDGAGETDFCAEGGLGRTEAVEQAVAYLNGEHLTDESDDADADPETGDETDAAEAVTDGGADPRAVGESDPLPEDETVRLITGIVGLMHTPEVVDGETSGTGKTIAVEHRGDSVRLDTREILTGESNYRDSTYYELYTPERLERRQRANHAPGPQAGANNVQEQSEMPEPTHALPEDETDESDDQDDDPDGGADAENSGECAECGDDLGDRVGDHCSTACAIEGRQSEAESDESTDGAEGETDAADAAPVELTGPSRDVSAWSDAEREAIGATGPYPADRRSGDPVKMETGDGWQLVTHRIGGNRDARRKRSEVAVWRHDDGRRVVVTRVDADDLEHREHAVYGDLGSTRLTRGYVREHALLRAAHTIGAYRGESDDDGETDAASTTAPATDPSEKDLAPAVRPVELDDADGEKLHAPTSIKPPADAYRQVPESVYKREMVRHGVAPSDVSLLAGQVTPATARRHGFHPDDQERRAGESFAAVEVHDAEPAEEQEYGFVCKCGGEVAEIWERISIRGGVGRYRCTSCGDTGEWRCDPQDADRSGLTGCLIRRDELDQAAGANGAESADARGGA